MFVDRIWQTTFTYPPWTVNAVVISADALIIVVVVVVAVVPRSDSCCCRHGDRA